MSTPIGRHDASLEDALGLRIPARYRHDWALFADWCTAADQPCVPATPEALALFLREHPAAPATQRQRVSAINTVHTRHGHPAPGRSETVRRRLDGARVARADRLAPLLHRRAAELPTMGWPSGVFGRRDALLLTLAATGMPFTQLTRLRRGDVTVDAGTLVATTDGERFCVPPESGSGESPAVAVYRRWAEIQAFLDAYPNTDLLAQHLTDPVEVEQVALTDRQARQHLLTPIDRWGHLPLMPQPMTAQSIASIVRDHLSGRVPARAQLPLRKRGDRDDAPPIGSETGIDLDPHYYERGVAARRSAHDNLDGLTDVFDEIEARADALLEELLTMLDGL
ncbi:hypothetical protein G6038_09300 [Rhodococcus sp. 14C212]|uniref:hypothetical protein n=1 Tax=Rhodococcus sp. 14C212 TaxID=2711209 RepID=UPI0013ECA51B|nr:hypothetical protein [Rhodococcus sp. 14C212]NGP05676.1 hypothetical protein [Rhodococcus sp. 14C212]